MPIVLQKSSAAMFGGNAPLAETSISWLLMIELRKKSGDMNLALDVREGGSKKYTLYKVRLCYNRVLKDNMQMDFIINLI
jgi:hypothetical protein